VIADSKLLHPLHQALFDEAAAAKPVDEDSDTIEGLRNEQRYRDAFNAAMDAGKIDAVIFPAWAQLPAINGDPKHATGRGAQAGAQRGRFSGALGTRRRSSATEDLATARAESHRSPSYTSQLKMDALKGARLGVLRQVFRPAATDSQIIVQFEITLGELRRAGAEIVDPFVVPEIDSIPRPPQTPARFKDDYGAALGDISYEPLHRHMETGGNSRRQSPLGQKIHAA
jgi:hypothetical protein